MEVFANEKNIPTYSFGNLFTQGERLADTINIIVDRFYNDTDLSNASFLMKGVTEDGWEINQVIASKRADIKKINLKWNVSGDFTINCGNLQLELSAYYPKNDEINTIIKREFDRKNQSSRPKKPSCILGTEQTEGFLGRKE